MGLLQRIGMGPAYLKAGFLGFPASGKTHTAALVAIGLKKHLKIPGPVAMYDTEGGSEYVGHMVREQTGTDFLGIKSRSFDDLIGLTKEAEAEGVCVLIVDSITHVWRELSLAYMQKMNAKLVAQNRRPKARMDIQDIMALKELWAAWPDLYLNSKLHIIICGRAGFEWDMELDDETGKKKLVKTGVKMKVETEFGFEPSLLVEMERVQDMEAEKPALIHQATILKDRFNVIDAKTCKNPGFEFFLPHIKLLVPGSHAPIDTSIKSDVNVDEDGNPEWQRERKERVILCEEIQGLLMKYYPSQSAKDKAAKTELVENAFGTRSWTRVQDLASAQLRIGLEHIKCALVGLFAEAEPEGEEAADTEAAV
jgi:hypothetical protein